MYNPYAKMIEQLEAKIAESEKLLNDPELGELAKIDLEQLKQEKAQLETAAAQMEQPAEEAVSTQKTNCILEIRQGAGGEEAKIWADDLLRMYIRFSEIVGFKLQYLDEMVVKFTGKVRLSDEESSILQGLTPYELLKYETGVHRVQRVPETEAQGRIHTSTATVAVLPEVPKTAVEIREEDIEMQFMRAGGAGGQHVNKTSSAVRLTHIPSGISVSARAERSQFQNRETAMEMLRAQLWEVEEEKRLAALGSARAGIGRAQRAEKIRTYNFPQNRVTDHRTKQSWYNLPEILDGQLVAVLSDLHTAMKESPNDSLDNEEKQ